MKILKSDPEKLQEFLQQLVDLGKQVFPKIGRTIIGDHLLNRHQDKDFNTATSLWWDKVKYDAEQDVHYIKNIIHSNYDQQYLDMIQVIINDLGLVEDDNFIPTPSDELN